MAGRTILETARLVLREFDEGDVGPFFLLGSDPAVTRYTGDPAPLRDHAHALQVLRDRPLADYRTHGFGRWACVLKETGEVVGFCGLKRLPELGGEVDLGYRFLPACWGRGLATEAGMPVLDFGFTRLKLARILGLVHPANAASVRVLQKLGLVHVGEADVQGQHLLEYAIEADGWGGAS